MKRTSGAHREGARWMAASALAAVISAGAAPASAQPSPTAPSKPVTAPRGSVEVQGVVLEINQDDLVLDLGAATGVTENQVIEIWRPFKLKHPVTGKVLTDRFKIGQIQVSQVRPAMSLAKPSGALARPAAPGDLVIFHRAGVVPSPSPVASGGPAAPATPYDDPEASPAPTDLDARNVTEMFEALRGQSIAARIGRYEQFLRAHPDSRFAQVLYEESMALRQLMTRAPSPQQQTAARTEPLLPRLVNGPGALHARQGSPLRIALELAGPVNGAVLQLRRKGDSLYTTTAMTPAGDGYYAAEIAGDSVQDRDFEYFIEAVGESGAQAVVGAPGAPERIRVEPTPPVRVPPSGLGSVSVLTDFADYNRARGNDYAWQTEGTFGIRFKDLGIRAVRMGFGVFRGVSGTVKELDEEGKMGREVGLTYGFVEGELGLHRYFSLIGRVAVGLLDEGVSGGGQLFGRIGNDRGTNLLLGGEVLGGVGLRSIVELQLNTFERFPIVLRTEVTNQPAGITPSSSQLLPGVAVGTSDVAGRGIVQVGFRPVPALTLAVRGSFQGRNINHAGPGVGGSVGYTW